MIVRQGHVRTLGGPWDGDPRRQVLLDNTLDYLLTPPKPTPPQSPATSILTILSGVNP